MLANEGLGLPKNTLKDKLYREKNVLKTLGEFVLGAPLLLAFRFSEKAAAAREVEKQWTGEEYAPGAAVSGHGPTHLAADELGNHGNARRDARKISSFAWAKEGMQISEDVNKAGGENARDASIGVFGVGEEEECVCARDGFVRIKTWFGVWWYS